MVATAGVVLAVLAGRRTGRGASARGQRAPDAPARNDTRWRGRVLSHGATALVTLFVGAALAAVLMGLYNFAAVRADRAFVYEAIAAARDLSIAWQARDVHPPDDFAARATPEAVALYEANCRPCHGAPGRAPSGLALGMNPVPPGIVASAVSRPPEEIYWIIENGLRMTGMPAWTMRLEPRELWELTALVEATAEMTPAEYAALAADAAGAAGAAPARPEGRTAPAAPAAAGPASAERGRTAVRLYGCHSCHILPGVTGRAIFVGPSLEDLAGRSYIAGVLMNTPDNLVRWIMHPQAVDPLTAMPDVGVPLAAARDIAAYLYAAAPRPTPPPNYPSGVATDGSAGRGADRTPSDGAGG